MTSTRALSLSLTFVCVEGACAQREVEWVSCHVQLGWCFCSCRSAHHGHPQNAATPTDQGQHADLLSRLCASAPSGQVAFVSLLTCLPLGRPSRAAWSLTRLLEALYGSNSARSAICSGWVGKELCVFVAAVGLHSCSVSEGAPNGLVLLVLAGSCTLQPLVLRSADAGAGCVLASC